MSAGWDAALRHAVRAFGVGPDKFWILSVREWRALTGGGVAPLSAEEFAAMRAAFPDEDAPST